jgi:FAD/FMN-containing dehydrogenase
VRGLELVSPDGQLRWCSPDANEEIFRRTLAGVGQLGVITRVRLATTPEVPDVSIYGYQCASLSAMADSFAWMEDPGSWAPEYLRAFSYKPERPGILLYGAMGRRNGAEAIDGYESELEPVRRQLGDPQTTMSTDNVRAVEHEFDNNWVARYPEHQRLWIDYGFSYDGFRAYCRELERMARADEFGKTIRAVYVSVIPRPPHGGDYFPFDIRPSGAGRTFTCGTYCMVPVGDAEALKRVRRALRKCQELMLELGGRPYVYGFNQMAPIDWRHAFGDAAVEQLMRLKRTVDPAGTISGPWDRIEPDGKGAPLSSRRFRPGTADLRR